MKKGLHDFNVMQECAKIKGFFALAKNQKRNHVITWFCTDTNSIQVIYQGPDDETYGAEGFKIDDTARMGERIAAWIKSETQNWPKNIQ